MPTIKAKRGIVASSKPATAVKAIKRPRAARPKTRISVSPAENFGENAQDSVAERAYFHWLNRGCPEGSPHLDWFRAEMELQSRQADHS